jgi:hypothetical protein
VFFEAERRSFFRPLNGKRRELVAACLRSLYERLHGPSADYNFNLTKDALRDLLMPIVQEFAHQQATTSEEEEYLLSPIDTADERELAGALIRGLTRDGWLESFGDRSGLITSYRFTRAGKLFAEALWEIERPRARARQRNMRSCRNSLEAVTHNGESHDLLDAYDYAERVLNDLSEGVDYFNELVRRLMAEASETPWEEFVEFLNRFEREFKKSLTADNVERHRQAIRDAVSRARALSEEERLLLDVQLEDIALWVAREKTGDSASLWLLDRIEEMVEAACLVKQPELLKAMNSYLKRASAIVQQAMLMRSGQRRHAFARAVKHAAELSEEDRAGFFRRLGAHLAAAEIRLIDPVTVRLRPPAERRRALTVSFMPKPTEEARLAAAQLRAEAAAFSLSNEEIATFLLEHIKAHGKPILLSDLPARSATDVLRSMQAVESVRSAREVRLKAKQLPSRFDNGYYEGFDYSIEMEHSTHGR